VRTGWDCGALEVAVVVRVDDCIAWLVFEVIGWAEVDGLDAEFSASLSPIGIVCFSAGIIWLKNASGCTMQ
jgi:hypothetical protein